MTSPIAPYITPAGIVVHDFAACLAWLQQQYRSIYGEDVYLGNDSQDGQWVAIQARAIADCNAAAAAVFNALSPATAQGNGLSSVVKINGLRRAATSASTADVTIVGVAGTVITNGQATDSNGNTWALPASVTIPAAGTITITATSVKSGAIAAAAGSINKIKTAVFGWQTVTNAQAAVPGAPVETDAALRLRQSQSVAAPSTTILDGVLAAIAGLSGVTRLRGYENNTNDVDTNGIPAKNVAILAEGGDQLAIAQAIALKMTPGTPMVGAIAQTIISAAGSSRVVKFARPTAAQIHVNLTVKALSGWSAGIIQPIIAQAIANYLSTLRIGENVRYFDVAIPAKILDSPYTTAFSLSAMTIAKNAGAHGTTDLTLAYNEVPIGNPANVAFTVI